MNVKIIVTDEYYNKRGIAKEIYFTNFIRYEYSGNFIIFVYANKIIPFGLNDIEIMEKLEG